MKKRWTIYCHTHIESGRRYIGLTSKTMLARWNGHVNLAKRSNGKRSHFAAAIRKYGKEAFSHEVLEICYDLEVANLAEECWIEFYETRNPEKGFNLMRGGEHVPHPIRKNPWNDPEFRRKNVSDMSSCRTPAARAANLAAIRQPESLSKISDAARRAWTNPEYRAHKANISREIFTRPDVITKISNAAKRRKSHCLRGHSLDDSIQRSNGQRACRQCALRRSREWRARKLVVT